MLGIVGGGLEMENVFPKRSGFMFGLVCGVLVLVLLFVFVLGFTFYLTFYVFGVMYECLCGVVVVSIFFGLCEVFVKLILPELGEFL